MKKFTECVCKTPEEYIQVALAIEQHKEEFEDGDGNG